MNKINILINTFSIQDSGGITVLHKLLNEIKNSKYSYLVVCSKNKNIEELIRVFQTYENIDFLTIKNKGLLYRLYYENIIFHKIIKDKKINFIYNFSGSAQFFLKIPQMTKVHNLLFYSKNTDNVYFTQQRYIKWIKQVFLKRIIFHTMIKQAQYIEIQSNHVQKYMSDFLNLNKKKFYIKSDIDVIENLFIKPRNYDLNKKISFLYIVGPHFEYIHKNFIDFVGAMSALKSQNFDFEINITLTKEQLHNSSLWDVFLDNKTNFLGYISSDNINKQFKDNTILVSTSVIETLGLHVIEAVKNGTLAIVPNEKYSLNVYGSDILRYELFNVASLLNRINKITLLNNNNIKDIILKNQQYLIDNENTKNKNIINIFDEILKGNNV